MEKENKNYYRVLQVDASAEPEVIEAAYRRLAKKYHPDIYGTGQAGQPRMTLINEAYQVLRDPQKRAEYDLQNQTVPTNNFNDFGETPLPVSKSDFGYPTLDVPHASAKRDGDFIYKIAKITLNFAIVLLVLVILGVIGWMLKERFFPAKKTAVQPQAANITTSTAPGAGGPTVNTGVLPVAPFAFAANPLEFGITRMAMLHTTIPTRPRGNVIEYSVVKGDNLFVIGEKFGIKPETVLWGNYEVLNDNPRMLKIGQVLKILPTDGTYHKWKEGDTLAKVAETYKTTPQSILEYSGNRFDLSVSTAEDPGINPGTWLIIPGGKRPLKDWGPPAISRSNPAVAAYYGEGFCGKVYTGAVGNGYFVWPVPSNHTVSGYDYTDIHKGIDIGGQLGAPVVAADSGVVVFAGWSEYGYGNFLVIDHGNGWQTGYGHLNTIGAACGQSVMGGGTVATLGNTGNSTGPHLHFEMKYNGANANPHDFVN